MTEPDPRLEVGRAAARDAVGLEAQPRALKGAGNGRPTAVAGDVRDARVDRDGRGAGPTAEPRSDEGALHVEVDDPAQVDLAQDPVVVPPTPVELAVAPDRQGREVELLAAAVDPDHEPVHLAPPDPLGAKLERQISPHVLPDRPPIQPRLRAVVDRLEAEDPVGVAARARDLE